MTFTDPPENVRSLVADIASLREYGVPMGRINALTTGLVSIVEEYESRLGHHKIDQLTGLMTRKTLEEEFSKIQNTDRRSPNQSLVAIVFDIIELKKINDNETTGGYKIGDLALQRMAEILHSTFRAEDKICRLGGDEFVVLVRGSNRYLNKILPEKLKEMHKQMGCITAEIGPLPINFRYTKVPIAVGLNFDQASRLFDAKNHKSRCEVTHLHGTSAPTL